MSQEQKTDMKLEYNRNSQFRYLSQYRGIIIGHPTGMIKSEKHHLASAVIQIPHKSTRNVSRLQGERKVEIGNAVWSELPDRYLSVGS